MLFAALARAFADLCGLCLLPHRPWATFRRPTITLHSSERMAGLEDLYRLTTKCTFGSSKAGRLSQRPFNCQNAFFCLPPKTESFGTSTYANSFLATPRVQVY